MKILIETVPHELQRYPTTGDWGAGVENAGVTSYDPDGDVLLIRVSDMGDWRYAALVGIHEAIEAVLCKRANVTEEAVNAFDIDFEGSRDVAKAQRAYPYDAEKEEWVNARTFSFRGRSYGMNAEPGDSPDAPYYKQHQIATSVERLLAAELGVDWTAYEEANLRLYD